MKWHKLRDIYALCDFESLEKRAYTLEDFISKIEPLPIIYIQYRDKINSKEIQIVNLQRLKSLTNIPIIINDNLDLIEYADGLHLGQEDLNSMHQNRELAIKLIRKKIGKKIFGISTHNELEILEANKFDLDYIGLGAYRGTSTKDVDTILGEKAIYLAKLSKHPVALIGGVKKDDMLQNVTMNVIGSNIYDN